MGCVGECQPSGRRGTGRGELCTSPPQDEEPFNPDYVEVDRILDESHSVDKDNGEVTRVGLGV